MDELFAQTEAVFSSARSCRRSFPSASPSTSFRTSTPSWRRYTREECKMVVEIKKISIRRSARRHVRARVFIGHSEAVNVEFENPITVRGGTRRAVPRRAAWFIDAHERGGYVRLESVGEDATYRRTSRGSRRWRNRLTMWVVSDDLRKETDELDAIQIAETLIARKLIAAKRKAGSSAAIVGTAAAPRRAAAAERGASGASLAQCEQPHLRFQCSNRADASRRPRRRDIQGKEAISNESSITGQPLGASAPL